MKVYELMSLLGKAEANKDVSVLFLVFPSDVSKFGKSDDGSCYTSLEIKDFDLEDGTIYVDF